MRCVVQRVSQAQVDIDGQTVGRIAMGVMVLVGVGQGDAEKDADYLADKTALLRIFPDENDRMNRSLVDIDGSVLAISQFTLWGDCRKGRRPAFTAAAAPEIANPLYERYCQRLRTHQLDVQTGVFAADMQVQLVNDGPVTILLDSQKQF